MSKKNIIQIFLLLCIVPMGIAQESKIKKANEDFFNYDYIDARKIYLKVVEDGYTSAQVFEKLGDTYYFNSEYAEASKWYVKLIEQYPDQVKNEYYFRTAQTLKSVGKFDESKAMMEKFQASSNTSDLAQNQLNNWKSFEDLSSSENKKFKVTNITPNMSGSDFGPSFYGDKIVFASSSINTEGNKVHDWNGLPYLDLFEAEIGENGNLSHIQALKGDINSPYHESSPVFTKDGNTVYFTRNNYINGKKKRGKKRLVSLKIYMATKKDDGTWGNIVELPFNDDSYSTAHPALNNEETKLYFSSNMEGTLGESDIWYVDILENGNYGKPVNMGPGINTQERETFPFISDKNKLFFSSDGHVGLGGLDIFMASFNDELGSFWSIQNLGQPINSNQDDFGFIVREHEKIGYLSSNRGGIGGSSFDDIYSVTENCKPVVYGAVTDAKTGKPLEGSIVYLIDKDNKIVSQQVTEQNGNYAFEENIACENQYVVRASNDEKEYQPLEKVISTPAGSMSLQVDLALVPPDCPVNDLGCRLDLQPIYFDFDKHNIRPDAEVELAKILQAMKQYPQLNIHIGSHTDSRGDDNYNMQLSERRAKSTLEWLVEKGIDRNRLTSKGYGESQLINECDNNANCTQEAHQLNRRSMFIIKQISFSIIFLVDNQRVTFFGTLIALYRVDVNSCIQNLKPCSMKKLVLIIAAVVFGIPSIQAETINNVATTTNYRYGNSFIFVEDGVTFSVYPDGEFDFYIDNRVNVGVGAQIGNVGITFNSGYNYNPFVQYDDYGAVIQVENTPIFYDYYGRVSQIGNVDIWYNNGRVRRIGGLHVYYNGGVFSHYTGYINIYNRGYVYRPFHRYFARPAIGFCNVYARPYRRYYRPVRYTYYAPYRHNTRRAYARLGKVYRNNNTYRRENIYRNDRRVAVRDNSLRRADYGRSNATVSNNSSRRGNSNVNRSSNSVQRQKVATRDSRSNANRKSNNVTRSSGRTTASNNKATRASNNRSASARKASPNTSSRTVSRSAQSTYRKPQTTSRTPNRSAVSRSSSPSRKAVSRSSSPSVRKSSVSRKSSSRPSVSRSSSARKSSARTSSSRGSSMRNN